MIPLASGISSIPRVICVIIRMRFQECDRRSRHEIPYWHSSLHCLSKMAAYSTKKRNFMWIVTALVWFSIEGGQKGTRQTFK